MLLTSSAVAMVVRIFLAAGGVGSVVNEEAEDAEEFMVFLRVSRASLLHAR
jgi:hypothetical protein